MTRQDNKRKKQESKKPQRPPEPEKAKEVSDLDGRGGSRLPAGHPSDAGTMPAFRKNWLAQGILMREILGPPRALRPWRPLRSDRW